MHRLENVCPGSYTDNVTRVLGPDNIFNPVDIWHTLLHFFFDSLHSPVENFKQGSDSDDWAKQEHLRCL